MRQKDHSLVVRRRMERWDSGRGRWKRTVPRTGYFFVIKYFSTWRYKHVRSYRSLRLLLSFTTFLRDIVKPSLNTRVRVDLTTVTKFRLYNTLENNGSHTQFAIPFYQKYKYDHQIAKIETILHSSYEMKFNFIFNFFYLHL